MGLVVAPRGASRRLFAALALAVAVPLAFTARADAAELVFWDNYRAEPTATVSFANIDGSGGGALNLSGIELLGPEGMAFDSATNRLFIADSGDGSPEAKGQIVYANADGSGAGVLRTPGAPVEAPYGVAIDPASRIIYWANDPYEGTPSIAWARLDGSGGGTLNVAGAVLQDPYRLAVDPASGKVYWGETGTTPESVGYANLDNSGGGGNLGLPAAVNSLYGIAVDSAAGRVYWLDSSKGKQKLLYVNTNGSGGGEVSLAGSVNDAGYGLAIDSALGRIYWANYGYDASVPQAIGFANLAGGGGAITPTSAPVDGAQDPVILKSPSGTGAPVIARGADAARAQLSCSSGSWGGDYPGSFVYQAARSFAYQWSHNGAAIGGATNPALTASAPGSYACTVTATNHAGSTSQSSAATEVSAAVLSLALKRRNAKAKPGKIGTFRVEVLNQGDLAAASDARLCLAVPKRAKADLKPRKCKQLAGLPAASKLTLALKVKVKQSAERRYKLRLELKGVTTAAKAPKVALKVVE